MWNALKQFVQRMNEEGRAKFNPMTLDAERKKATMSNVAMIAGLGASILTWLYFVLLIMWLFFYHRDALGSPQLWARVFCLSCFLGCIQGGIAGAILGWGQAEYWQGKRNKAGTICAFGGAGMITAMLLIQAQYYRPGTPVENYIFWALLLFSPGYLTATSLIAWGLSLLNKD